MGNPYGPAGARAQIHPSNGTGPSLGSAVATTTNGEKSACEKSFDTYGGLFAQRTPQRTRVMIS